MKMKSILIKGAAVAVFIAISSVQASAAKCVMAGGEGTGVTPEIAKSLSAIALNTSITNMSAKAKGKVATTCQTTLVVSTCTSRQRACK